MRTASLTMWVEGYVQDCLLCGQYLCQRRPSRLACMPHRMACKVQGLGRPWWIGSSTGTQRGSQEEECKDIVPCIPRNLCASPASTCNPRPESYPTVFTCR